MTSLFSYLHDSLKVTPVNDGEQLQVTVTLPSDHFLHFLRILDSLTGFVHVLNKHARLERRNDKKAQEYRAQEAKYSLASGTKLLVTAQRIIFGCTGLTVVRTSYNLESLFASTSELDGQLLYALKHGNIDVQRSLGPF